MYCNNTPPASLSLSGVEVLHNQVSLADAEVLRKQQREKELEGRWNQLVEGFVRRKELPWKPYEKMTPEDLEHKSFHFYHNGTKSDEMAYLDVDLSTKRKDLDWQFSRGELTGAAHLLVRHGLMPKKYKNWRSTRQWVTLPTSVRFLRNIVDLINKEEQKKAALEMYAKSATVATSRPTEVSCPGSSVEKASVTQVSENATTEASALKPVEDSATTESSVEDKNATEEALALKASEEPQLPQGNVGKMPLVLSPEVIARLPSQAGAPIIKQERKYEFGDGRRVWTKPGQRERWQAFPAWQVRAAFKEHRKRTAPKVREFSQPFPVGIRMPSFKERKIVQTTTETYALPEAPVSSKLYLPSPAGIVDKAQLEGITVRVRDREVKTTFKDVSLKEDLEVVPETKFTPVKDKKQKKSASNRIFVTKCKVDPVREKALLFAEMPSSKVVVKHNRWKREHRKLFSEELKKEALDKKNEEINRQIYEIEHAWDDFPVPDRTSLLLKAYYCEEAPALKASQKDSLEDAVVEAYAIDHENGMTTDLEEALALKTSKVLPRAQSAEESTVEQIENTTFVDQTETQQEEAYLTPQLQPNMEDVSMQERQWHVRNVLRKPVIAKILPWSTNDGGDKVLYTATLPGDMLKPPHSNISKNFVYWRAHPVIRIQVNATKFHFGRLLCVWLPMSNNADHSDQLWSTHNLTSFPYTIIDASVGNSGVLSVPFTHMYTYFNTVTSKEIDFLGQFRIIVFNRLGATTGASPTVDVTVWIHWENAELHQPYPEHPIDLPRAQAGYEGLIKAGVSLLPGLTKTVGNVIGMSSNCDKPTDPTEISRWVPNTVTSLNFGDGLDKSNRLSLLNGTYTLSDADLISTTQDDTNLLSLMKIPTRIDKIGWSTTQAPQTQLWRHSVSPTRYTYLSTPQPSDHGPVQIYTVSLLAYITRAFKFWRGGLRYRVQVVASAMQSGRIQVSLAPGADIDSFETGNVVNTYIIDLREKHEVEFVVPYMSERPWLRGDQFHAGPVDRRRYPVEIGQIAIHVINRLTCPDSTSQHVEINIFVCAADDFEVAFVADLSHFVGSGRPVVSGEASALKAPAAAVLPRCQMNEEVNVTDRTGESSLTLTKGGGTISTPPEKTMGENCMDLKTILRRYYLTFDSVGKVSHHSVIMFPNRPELSAINIEYAPYCYQYRSILSHFSQLFTFWRGSLRYKLVVLNDSNGPIFVTVYHVPGMFQERFLPTDLSMHALEIGSLENGGVIIASTQIQGSLEFEIPFYTSVTQLQTWGKPDGFNSTGTVVVKLQSPFETRNVMVKLYQAAGDDFSFNLLRGAPRLLIASKMEDMRNQEDSAPWITRDAPTVMPAMKPRAQMFTALKKVVTAPYTLLNNSNEAIEAVRDAANATTEVLAKTGLTARKTYVEDICDESDDSIAGDGPVGLVLNALAKVIGSLPSMAGFSKAVLSWTVTISNLVSGFNSFLQTDSAIIKACAIVTICSELLGTALSWVRNRLLNVAQIVINYVTGNGSEQGNGLPRAQAELLTFVPAIIATCVTGAAVLGYKCLPTDSDTEKLVKLVSDRSRCFNNIMLSASNVKTIWTRLTELFEELTDWLLAKFAPDVLERIKLNEGFDDVVAFGESVEKFYNENYVDRSNWDIAYRNQILKLEESAMKFNTKLIEGKVGREASVLRDLIKKALEMGLKVKESEKSLPFRVDPYCVMIYGDPGVGKSTAVLQFMNFILDRQNFPRQNRLCAVNLTEQFFTENYDNQIAVYMDDMSAFNSEEQYKNFFNLKANTEYPLNMAFKKGKRFTSKFIFSTTNSAWPAPNCLTTPLAFWRRRDALIHMRWKPDRNDWVNPKERDDEFSCCEFGFLNPTEPGDEVGELQWMSFEEMKVELALRATDYMRQQEHLVTRRLQEMGYIQHPVVPRPQALHTIPERSLDPELVRNHPVLSLWQTEILEDRDVYWDEEKATLDGWYIDPNLYDSWLEDYPNADFRLYLFECSYIVEQRGRWETLRVNLDAFKAWLNTQWQKASERFPFMEMFKLWPAKLAAALAAAGALLYVGKKAIHHCLCVTITRLGFRCGLCGKWPKLADAQDKEWLLSEWKEVYGETAAYEDNRLLSLKEEQDIREVEGSPDTIREPIIGTKRAYSQGVYSTDVKGGKVLRVIANHSPYASTDRGSPRVKVMAQSQQVNDMMVNRVIPATYRIRGHLPSASFSVNAVAIKGRLLIAPKHFFLPELTEFEIYHSNAWMVVLISTCTITPIPNKDLVIVEMPIQFHQHKDLTRHFVAEHELPYLQRTRGFLCVQDHRLQYRIQDKHDIVPVIDLEYTICGEETRIQSCWKYPMINGDGLCGSLLLTSDDRVSGKILGFHVAGDDVNGWAQLVTREMLQPYTTPVLGTPTPAVVTQKLSMLPRGHFGVVGQVPPGKGVHQTAKTQIIPTEIHGMISVPTTAPAVLHSADPRLEVRTNVLKLAFEKYGEPSIPFDPELLNMVEENLNAEIAMWTIPRKPQILTKEEAVLGLPEYEGFDRLPMNTSPGYPYVLSRPPGELGKGYLFDPDTGKIVSEELQVAVDQRLTLAKRGERVISTWTCALKDERRPWKKIESGSTRMFSIPPCDYSIVCRMYSLDFTVAVKENRHTSFSQVGIDPQSLEWTQLHNQLSEFSPFVMAGDFSRFDGTFPPDITAKYFAHVNFYYKHHGECSKADEQVRAVLLDENVHTVHISNRDIIVNHTGNESGDPCTVIKNSVGNFYYLAVAWLSLAREHCPEKATMASFRANVLCKVYGDDNLVAIKPSVLDWYNQETVSNFLAKFGIVYTNESKTGITKYSSLDEVAFLKNKFARHEDFRDIWVPLMSENTIMELLNWTRVAPDQLVLLKDNINDALRFMYFYGYQRFHSLRTEICEVLKRKNLNITPMTYNDFHYWFMYVIGKLPKITPKSQNFLEYVAHNFNSKFSQKVQKITLKPLYKLLGYLGSLQSCAPLENRTNRYAIAIPSGEGKTWLCHKYPGIFVDHDDLLLPAARRVLREHGLPLPGTKNWDRLSNIFQEELPPDDRRILLVHHPDNTSRKILGCFKLPIPSYVRANLYQRLRLTDAVVLPRDERNAKILELAKVHEPSLFPSSPE